MSSTTSHTIYSVSSSPVCGIYTSISHSTNACHMLQTFRQVRIQRQILTDEFILAPCTPTRMQELPPTWHQTTIITILPPPNASDTQHHIQFISSYVGTMICVVCSSFFGVETTKSTSLVVTPPMFQNHLICTLSTLLGYTSSTNETYSYFSTNTTRFESQL